MYPKYQGLKTVCMTASCMLGLLVSQILRRQLANADHTLEPPPGPLNGPVPAPSAGAVPGPFKR